MDKSSQLQSQIKQQKGGETMAYTPELSQIGSAILRGDERQLEFPSNDN